MWNSVKMQNSVKIRNSVFRGIPYNAEFRKNAEFHKNTEFRIPRNSVKMDVLISGKEVFTVTGGHVIWLTEQRQLTVKEVGIP